jgi:purine-binding chemotaxis protein CheW
MTELGGQLMLIAVGPRRCAVPVGEVAEVVTLQPLHPIPGAPAILAGAMNSHGRILPVISLAALWGLPTATADNSRLVVFDDWLASMAVLADDVLAIIPLSEVLEEDEADVSGVTRRLMMADGEVDLLTCQELLGELERLLPDRRGLGAEPAAMATEG